MVIQIAKDLNPDAKTSPSSRSDRDALFVSIVLQVLEVARDFFNTFRIRAVFHHNPLAWDIEVRRFVECSDSWNSVSILKCHQEDTGEEV